MPNEFGQWERVASELRAYREAQQQAWGDVDNATLGRYLAGDVTPQERRRIETALEERPELRKLTDLVSDVLRDCEPISTSENARPAVLPFRAPLPRSKPMTQRWRRWVAAAACLLLALGYTVLPKGGSGPNAGLPEQALAPPGLGSPLKNTMALHLPTPDDSDSAKNPVAVASDDKKGAALTLHFDPVALCADGLSNAGSAYARHGDLDLAAFSYHLAYNIRESNYGAEAPPTVEARRNLGDVYQTALAMADDVAAKADPMAPDRPPAGVPTAPYYATTKDAEVRNSASQLRDRITRQPVRDVRKSVVPVLMQNLREAQTAETRVQLGRALAELGPAAEDAIPILKDCLQKAETPQERAVVLRALGELGQTAGTAATPVLVTSMKSPFPEERRAAEEALANYGPSARDAVIKLADGAQTDHKEWRSLKERLLGVEGRIGVRDGCEVCSVLAVKQVQKEIRELARTSRVEVFAETRPNPTAGDAPTASKDRAREIDVNGVYFVIHPSPLAVEAYVGDALRGQGFDETQLARLRQVVAEAGKQSFDAGLLEGVRFVSQFVADKGKKTAPDMPPPSP